MTITNSNYTKIKYTEFINYFKKKRTIFKKAVKNSRTR